MLRPVSDLVLRETTEGVTTLTMNHPRRLNGWTEEMLRELLDALRETGKDDATEGLILTGTGDYYCAGVNLGGALQPGHPADLYKTIIERNQLLFETFLSFPKPILVAANGPAIGASVTSATLCNGILAAEEATFSTPFARLGVTPEGCSSVVFPKLIGDAAERMLGAEGWAPTGREAVEIGLAMECVPKSELTSRAHAIVRGWIDDGVGRVYPCGMSHAELSAINAEESRVLARAFLQPDFLMGQFKFLWSKHKRPLALSFLTLAATRPAWSRLLPPEAR